MRTSQSKIVFFGVLSLYFLLFLWPHFLAYFQTGDMTWLPHFDLVHVYLLPSAKALYRGLWLTTDPLFWDNQPNEYPWTNFMHGVKFADLFNMGAESLPQLWLFVSAITTALGFYFFFKVYGLAPATIFVLCLLVICDAGMIYAKPLYYNWTTILNLEAKMKDPWVLNQLRILSPGLIIGYYFFALTMLTRMRQKPGDKKRVLWAAVGVGSLFHSYFYYWTTAGLGLFLGMVFDRKYWKDYFFAGLISMVVGAPAIFQMLFVKFKSLEDAFVRQEKFVPIDHFSELIIPIIGLAFFVPAAIYLWRKREDLRPFILFTIASYILLNKQIFVGLQSENHHWKYAYGPGTVILFFLFGVELIKKYQISQRPWFKPGIITLCVLQLGSTFYLRTKEMEILGSKRIMEVYGAVKETEIHLEPERVFSGPNILQSLFTVIKNVSPLCGYIGDVSLRVTNQDWFERVALNKYLQGVTEAEYKKELENTGFMYGIWSRTPEGNEHIRKGRFNAFMSIQENPQKFIDKYKVKYFVTSKNKALHTWQQQNAKIVGEIKDWKFYEILN